MPPLQNLRQRKLPCLALTGMHQSSWRSHVRRPGADHVRVDEAPRKLDERGHVYLDELGVAPPVNLVESAEVADPGVVVQDVDWTTDGSGLPKCPRGIGLANICDDDLNVRTSQI